MYTLGELEAKITEWAHERNIITGLTPKDQMPKLVEEFGELGGAIVRNNQEIFKDSIGDIIVVLTIMAAQSGLTIRECLNYSWEEIKDRKGKVVNGVFVKEADL